MNAATILKIPESKLHDATNKALVKMVLSLRTELRNLQVESESKIVDLQTKLADKEAALGQIINTNTNKTANQPSSKQPEFNKDTGAGKKRKSAKKLIMDEKVLVINQSRHMTLLTTTH